MKPPYNWWSFRQCNRILLLRSLLRVFCMEAWAKRTVPLQLFGLKLNPESKIMNLISGSRVTTDAIIHPASFYIEAFSVTTHAQFFLHFKALTFQAFGEWCKCMTHYSVLVKVILHAKVACIFLSITLKG